MPAKRLPQTIYIDALALVPAQKSGVGLTLQQTLSSLSVHKEIAEDYKINLVVPLGKAKYLSKYTGPNVAVKTIYLPARALELLLRLRLLPPMDWLLGTGIYIFPNYRNWPLWRSRSLTYIYDVSFERFPETVQPKNQKYLKKYINRWIERADKVITITEQLKEEIEIYLHVPVNKIEVVYCAVDQKMFYKRSLEEVSAAKKKYGITYENYLLFVGNIEPRKNLLALLAAYEKLPKEIQKKYGLVIIGGDGWLNEPFYKQLVKAQKAGLEIIKVDKYVKDKDLPALYCGASALVHPAIYEGFGMTLLEAMACKIPVIASDIPAIREVVQTAGNYFNPNSPQNIARTIEHVLGEISRPEQEKVLHHALARVNEFNWGRSVTQLVEIIEDQFIEGPEARPLLKRIKLIYKNVDYNIRMVLGEKALKPYRPRQAQTKQDLQRILQIDFLREQPSYFQSFLLKLYLLIKHTAALGIRGIYGLVRRSNA